MRHSFLLAIFAVIALSANASAAEFSLNVTQPKTIYAGNATNFSAIIINSGADDWFSIAAIGTYSSWISIDSQNVFVPSGSTVSSTLWASPAPDSYENKYQYSIIATRASDKAKAEKEVFVDVLQTTYVIMKETSLSCYECKPGEMVSVSASLKNIGNRQISNMRLIFTYGNRTKTMPVASLEFGYAKAFSTDFSLDSALAPGQYKIDVKLMQDTAVLAEKALQLAVPPLPDIRTAKNVSSSIFGNHVILVAANHGNARQTSEIKSKILSAWYSVYSGAKPSSVGSEYGWQVSLAPKESVKIEYSEIFWPVPLLLVALAFAGVYYYIIVSSLSIRKRLIRGRASGEISISLDVKSGLRQIDNAVVRDVVPKEFAVSDKFESIKPVIRKMPSGTELVWRLGRLKSMEERILHYKIKHVSEFRTARLHPAELNGKRGDKLVNRTSNIVLIHGEPKEQSKTIKVVVK